MPKKGQSIRSALYFGNNSTGIPLVVWIGLAAVGWWYWKKSKDEEDPY